MDPATAAVVWLVVWFILIPVPIVAFSALGELIGLATKSEVGLVAGMSVGWIVGVLGTSFAMVQMVLQIVSLIRLLT